MEFTDLIAHDISIISHVSDISQEGKQRNLAVSGKSQQNIFCNVCVLILALFALQDTVLVTERTRLGVMSDKTLLNLTEVLFCRHTH